MSGGKDNTYPIYIRVTHLRQVGYIKTNKVCKAKFVRNGDITDPYIIKDVYVQIETYLDRLNRVNTEGWDLERGSYRNPEGLKYNYLLKYPLHLPISPLIVFKYLL